MPEKVKGHFRKGIWIGGYLREPKDRSASPQGGVPSNVTELHDCCEGTNCCSCGKKLESDEREPNAYGATKLHVFCTACRFEMLRARPSLPAKRRGYGLPSPNEFGSGAAKSLAHEGMLRGFVESTDGE